MSKWENNHKVTCSECLYSVIHSRWVDELPFRYNITCKLKHETDYRIPYSEYWDCEYFVKWSFWNIIKNTIKNILKR